MEKLKFNNSRGITLAGILYTSKKDRVIIMCHGYTSDKYMEGRTETLASKLLYSGFDCFSFDFSGCGESEDDSISITKEVEDLQSAVNFVKSLGYNKIAFYGHSLGALICLLAYTPDIVTMVLSAALTDTIIQELKAEYSVEKINELRSKGQIKLEISKGFRKFLLIDKQMLIDMEEINQENILSNVKCSVLIIHGDTGPDEPILLSKTQKGMKFFPNKASLEVIKGADHSFKNYLEILSKLTNNWFRKYFN